MSVKYLFSKNSRGDTIVEVLISIAIVSSVLGGAYVTASQNLNATREAQERVEASKLAQGQLEYLKGIAQNPATNLFTITSYFCVTNDLQIQALLSSPPASYTADNFSAYPNNCKMSPAGGNPYYVSVLRNNENTFTVRIRWDRPGKTGKDEVKFLYRVYPRRA